MNLFTTLNTYRLPIFALIGAVLFSAFTIWAGIPERGLPAFLVGLGVFLALTLFFAGLAWHLLARPLPPGQKQLRAEFLSPTLRHLFAVLLLAAGISLVIGGFWDEVWHRKYGLPFGEDLLWRPHLLIYFGLLTPPALAAFTFFRMLRDGAGSLQQRFRADPPAGLLVLAGVFLLYTVPADPIWHTIYGEDITAWSLPHLLLLVGVTLVMLLAVVMQLSTTPRRPWSSILRRSWDELLALLAFTFAFQLQLQVMVTDWENGNPALTGRPEWLLPAMLIGLGIFMGVAANRSLRVYGAASLLGTLTLLLRWGLIQIFDFPAIQPESWLGILPPLLALDLLYALRVSRGQGPPPALAAGLAAALGLVIGSLPLMAPVFDYPRITLASVPAMALTGFLAALLATWTGGVLGDGLASLSIAQSLPTRQTVNLRAVPALVFSFTVLFIIFFIVTAAPPVNVF
jgi:hypothetical protein